MFLRGRISYFTHPPETHTLPTHVSAEIVTEMGKAFDWDELEKGNQEVLAGKQVIINSIAVRQIKWNMMII